MRNRILTAESVALTLALAAPAAAQTTWYVDDDGTAPGTGTLADPYTSIQYAMDQPATVTFDVISVAAGTYVENLTFAKALSVIGAGPDLTVLQAAAPGYVVVTNGYLRDLRGLTITGGHGPGPSGGISVPNPGSPEIERCSIVGNAGTGVDWRSSEIHGGISQCTIADNGGPGVFMSHGSTAHFHDVIVWGNGADSTFNIGPHAPGDLFRFNDFENNVWGYGCNGTFCGNFSSDPMFVDAPNGDYRLMPGSPCIDNGDPNLPADPDGSPPDIGALIFDPAANPGPAVYCTSKTTSIGCVPSVGFTGLPSASGSTAFTITCADVMNNKLGLLFYGYKARNVPFQGGWLCVRSPAKRTPVQGSGGNPPPDDCSGQYAFDFGARILSGVDPALAVDALVYAQFWYRDPLDAFTTGRSDALTFRIRP